MIKLDKGKFTTVPVQTQFGWHVIEVDDIREAKVPPFDDVKTQLAQRMQGQAGEELGFAREERLLSHAGRTTRSRRNHTACSFFARRAQGRCPTARLRCYSYAAKKSGCSALDLEGSQCQSSVIRRISLPA